MSGCLDDMDGANERVSGGAATGGQSLATFDALSPLNATDRQFIAGWQPFIRELLSLGWNRRIQ